MVLRTGVEFFIAIIFYANHAPACDSPMSPEKEIFKFFFESTDNGMSGGAEQGI